MPLVSMYPAWDHEKTWHGRGQLGFAGALVLMILAGLVTDSLDGRIAATLIIALTVTAVVAVALFLAEQFTRTWSLLLWPVATVSTLVGYAEVEPEAGALLVGLIPMSFLFIGLSQPPGRGLWLLAPAVVAFVAVLDLDLAKAAIRVPLAMLIWWGSSELPSRLLTQVRGQRETLRVAATTDSLTGLLNRSTLQERMDSAAAGSAIALIDIDHFKEYNDTHGHPAGDVVLADFADMLTRHSRPTDDVIRYGGEEFLVIFHATDKLAAAGVVERYARVWSAHPSGLSFSAGVAAAVSDGIRIADQLLYQAKRNGRSRVMVDRPGPP